MSIDSLWGDEFTLPDEKEKVKKVTNKINKPKVVKEVTVEKKVKSKEVSLKEKLILITDEVYRVLGKQKDNIVCINDFDSYISYIKRAVEVGRIDIDTETNNSLDPVTCKLMGLCLYVPGEKQAYIPVNHRDPDTKEKLAWQITEQQIKEGLQILLDNKVKIIMHNAKFDYSVIKCTCDICVPADWDTFIGCKLLDENEYSAGLKQQYIAKIDPDQEKYSIEGLFEGVEYADVDPEVFAFYAATDSLMTDKLYEYQMEKFKNPELSKVLDLAYKLEMPLISVLAEMEMAGMLIDIPYSEQLSKKYHEDLDALDLKINGELINLKPRIDAWKMTPEATQASQRKLSEKQYQNAIKSASYDPSLYSQIKGEWYKISKSKLEQLGTADLTPEDLASATKLGILLYDVLKCPVVNKEKPYATGEDELSLLNKKVNLPLIKLILERRGLVKLITTYVDAIPELSKRWPDGRVRTHFNQYGAATGRLSSSDPLNFQNVPSKSGAKDIRPLFRAKPGYKIIGSDFSAQEPRLTAFYSQDDAMIKAYNEGRDLYSVIASMSFDKPYEDCLEFYPEGTKIIFEGQEVICGKKTHKNKEGTERRTQAKAVLLGILYGRGAASVGEQIGKSREEAQVIIDKFFKAFPKVKNWIDQSIEGCRKNGYVEDVAGRRRRLPDILLPKYTIKYKDESLVKGDFNPFLICSNRIGEDKTIANYRKQLESLKSRKQYEPIKLKAAEEGILISDNGGFIAQAERQAVNARVQGGAASLTKYAMLNISKDERLKNIGAYLVNAVHDELLIEAPEEYAEQAADYLIEDMVNSAKAYVTNVPMSCDPYIVDSWYDDERAVLIEKHFKEYLENSSKEEAFEKICYERRELSRDYLFSLLQGYMK